LNEQTELHQRIAQSHQFRQMAESFGTDPDRYDRTRPSYPAVMVQDIIDASPGRDVLDVGIGTGIVARQFQAAGCRVLGVEVDARMAEFARQHGSQVEVGKFEEWDPAGRTFDIVIAGQTWHWVDPVAGAAKAAAALRPGGRVGLFWNALEPPAALAGAFAEAYRQGMPQSRAAAPAGAMSAADGYSMMVAKAARGLREVGGFSEMEEWRFDWERTYTRDEWLDQLPTSGTLTQTPPEKLEPLLASVGAAIDAVGGRFTAHYTTVVGTATRANTA
jgi:SAM-dependent methyltransferase